MYVNLISTDIQEFYEITLLNTRKSCEQKLEEVNHMVDKWEKSVSVQNCELGNSVCPAEVVSVPHVVIWGEKGGQSRKFLYAACLNLSTDWRWSGHISHKHLNK